jgi:hypothetical protein
MTISEQPTDYIYVKADSPSEWDYCDFAIVRVTDEWLDLLEERLALLEPFEERDDFTVWSFGMGRRAISSIPMAKTMARTTSCWMTKIRTGALRIWILSNWSTSRRRKPGSPLTNSSSPRVATLILPRSENTPTSNILLRHFRYRK